MRIREIVLWFVLVAVLAAVGTVGRDHSTRIGALESPLASLQSAFLNHMTYLHVADSALIPRVRGSDGTWAPNPLFDPTPFYSAPEAGEEEESINGTE